MKDGRSDRHAMRWMATALLCAGLAAGCSDDDDASAPASSPDSTMSPSSDATVSPDSAGPALAPEALVGTWSTGCTLEDIEEPANGYETQTVTFTPDGFSVTAESWSDGACSARLEDNDDIEIAGTYVMGAAIVTAEGLPATEIDFTATPPESATERTILDLIAIQDRVLFFGEGDFDEFLGTDVEPRPTTLELDEPLRQ